MVLFYFIHFLKLAKRIVQGWLIIYSFRALYNLNGRSIVLAVKVVGKP